MSCFAKMISDEGVEDKLTKYECNLIFENEQRRLNLWDENLLKYFNKALSDSLKKINCFTFIEVSSSSEYKISS